uniref:ATP-dependent Clp protease proteolytic subunit n=1 Tax=Lathyrus graminifolius TaxID=457904 RepID=A0A0F6NE36_LATPG|nr:clp protease proteolytic subunit [Lathyrus graminifolius]AIK20704.1 clp protease proteolytic subunit [Lathyrus graminifolius]
MPLGLPKVPLTIPGDDESTWNELYYLLFYKRLIFLGQEVDSETGNQITGMLVYLSLQDKTKNLYMFINSPGGEVMSGLAIFDAMQFVEAEVQTICMGLAASMASLILLGGEIPKRLAFPHSRIMIHEPTSAPFHGQVSECILEAEELLVLKQIIINIYSQRTGKPFGQIAADMRRTFYMSPEEAQDYGIIDMVADSTNRLHIPKD